MWGFSEGRAEVGVQALAIVGKLVLVCGVNLGHYLDKASCRGTATLAPTPVCSESACWESTFRFSDPAPPSVKPSTQRLPPLRL